MAGYGEPFKETEIGELPESWQVVRFGEAVSIAEGQVDPRVPPYASMLHIGPENIESGTGRLLECRRALDLGLISGKYLFRPGDVVYSKIRPYLRKSAFVDFAGLCSADMYPLTARDGFEPRYVHYFILSEAFTRQAVSQQDRTGIPKLNREQLNRIVIPKPPVAEQRAMVAVLSGIEAAVEAQGRIVSALKELRGATMVELFREGLRGEPLKQTEIGQIPESWDVVPLHALLRVAQYGLSVRGERTGRYPILRMNCQEDGRVLFRDLQFVDLDEKTFDTFKLRDGDLLFNRTNSFELVGRTTIFHGDRQAVFASYLIRLRPDDEEALVPDFLNYYFNLDWIQAGLKSLATRGVSQSNISASKLKSFKVCVPSREEQRQVVVILDRVSEMLTASIERRDRIRGLFSAVLHLLMTGRVRVPLGGRGKDDGTTAQAKSSPGRRDPVTPEGVERFVSELERRFEPERVILFGKHAERSPRAFGDIGLFVEMDFAGLARDQAARIARDSPHDFSLDLVVRRPGDARRAIEMGDRFVGGIVEKGRVLYARPPAETRPSRAPEPEATAAGGPRRTLSEETLAEIVRRIVEAVQPEQIILFGSAARGEMGPDSDLDFLVVKSCANRREVTQTIYRSLGGIGVPKDIVVVTPEDVERDRDTVGYIIRPALREGRVVYAA